MTALMPYPEYKDSGFPTLDRIPDHWSVGQLRHAATCLDYLRVPKNSQERAEMPGTIPYWGANSVQGFVDRALVRGELVLLGEDGAPFFEAAKPVAFAVNEPIWPNNHVHVLRPTLDFDHRYLAFALNSVDYSLYIKGSTRDKLNQAEMLSIVLPFPPLSEQKAIADYLDRETAEIDAFIADQERLIDLLNERRSAQIRREVKGGLNWPPTDLKRGPEWVGDIPSSWSVEKVGWHYKVGNGSTPAAENPRYWTGGDIPWLNSSCVNDGYVQAPSKYVTEAALAECHLPLVPADSLLIALTGQGKTRATVAQLGIDSTINQHMAYLILQSKKLHARFGYWLFRAAYEELRFVSDSNGSTKGALTCGHLEQFTIPLPPIAEQEEIASRLDGTQAGFEDVLVEAAQAIELSRERRAALISAAVTGRVAVRAW